MFADLGAVVIDADRLAREAVAPGSSGLARVVEEFGTDVLAPDGSLDRRRLAGIVFGDRQRLSALESIVHPEVGARSDALAAAAPAGSIIVFDVPLLVEKELGHRYDVVVVVDAALETQMKRLVEIRGMSEPEVRQRLAAQATRAERLALADYVIPNDGGLDALRAEVERVWRELVEHGSSGGTTSA